MAKPNLKRDTLKLLKNSNISMEEISQGTGIKLRWLYYFRNEQLGEPGVDKVQAIYDYLNK